MHVRMDFCFEVEINKNDLNEGNGGSLNLKDKNYMYGGNWSAIFPLVRHHLKCCLQFTPRPTTLQLLQHSEREIRSITYGF
jgi:hypothetical protein